MTLNASSSMSSPVLPPSDMETPLAQTSAYFPSSDSNPFLTINSEESPFPKQGIDATKHDLLFKFHENKQNFNPASVEPQASSLIFFGESHRQDARSVFDQYESSSNNSPFQSAAEDPDEGILDGDHQNGCDDRDPLLFKAPSRQTIFHQFLSSAKGAVGKTKDKKMLLGPEKTLRHQRADLTISHPVQAGDEEELHEEHDQESPSSEGHHHHHDLKDSDLPKGKCSIGILLAAISCIFFATSALIVKVSRLHPMELLCVRGALQALFISPIVISSGNCFLGQPGARALLLSRAVLGSVSLIMSFASIHLIPLADAATCIFTSPVFVSLFACICLKELCSWFDVSMILITLLGVVLVSQPSFNFLNTGSWTSILGTICGLAAAMLTALAFIVLRQLKHVHYSVTVFWFSVVLAGFGAVLMVALDGFRVPADWSDIVDCVGIGICGFLGQVLLTKALQIEKAGPCAVARTLDIVLAFFYQITLLHDTPNWYSYLGSFLVVSCVLLTAFRRWYREKFMLDLDGATDHHAGAGGRRPEKLGGSGLGNNNRNCNYTRANTNM